MSISALGHTIVSGTTGETMKRFNHPEIVLIAKQSVVNWVGRGLWDWVVKNDRGSEIHRAGLDFIVVPGTAAVTSDCPYTVYPLEP